MEIILTAAVGALVASLVPLLKVVWQALTTERKRQDHVTVTVNGWDGSKVPLTIKPDSEESISLFLDELKAARFGKKAISPEPPQEERRAATTEAFY